MFSMLAVKSRIPPPQHSACILPRSLRHATIACFLPKESNISSLRLNLAILVSRILRTYIKGLKTFGRLIPQHIFQCNYGQKVRSRCSGCALQERGLSPGHVRHNEASAELPRKDYIRRVPSGGDLLTCE